MNEKALKKKQLIIKKAREVFAEKGFRKVTMKDIVDACEISRGGLYLYFDSVEKVFLEVLSDEKSKVDPEISLRLPENPDSTDMLSLYFYEQKKDILGDEKSLLTAVYEYSFEKKADNSETTLIEEQVLSSLSFLTDILTKGSKKGEIKCEKPQETALNIIYALEGMKILSRCMQISEDRINEELVFLMSGLLPKQ